MPTFELASPPLVSDAFLRAVSGAPAFISNPVSSASQFTIVAFDEYIQDITSLTRRGAASIGGPFAS
jgi:hypothetical protein